MEMPEQVRQVYETMAANAKEADELKDSVYIGLQGPEDWNSKTHHEWCVGDNYERGSFSMIFRPDLDKWFYRDKWSGEDREMKGGFNEALSNASIWYTG
jgi:hypothetical protein